MVLSPAEHLIEEEGIRKSNHVISSLGLISAVQIKTNHGGELGHHTNQSPLQYYSCAIASIAVR